MSDSVLLYILFAPFAGAIALIFALWLPGRLLLDLLRPKQRLDWGEQVALSVGMSMAVIPLVLTWTTVLGLHWNRAGIWGAAILLWAALLWRARRIPLERIRCATAVTYSPLWDYGGWGIRCGRKGIAYNVSGDRGVQLELERGRPILIGSQRAEELARAIEERMSLLRSR